MIAEQAIPLYNNLTDVFGSADAALKHAQRWDNLAAAFQERFGKLPTYIARAPGRVNLIGEHIDYALFGVLPAAIERDILIACAPKSAPPATEPGHGSVVAENLHPKYTRQAFTPTAPSGSDIRAWHLDINTKELRWESYVKAGYYGVLNHHFSDSQDLPVPVDLLVTGSVPAGSGLSSSAAMVVASTLAFLAVNGKLEERDGLTEKVLNKGQLVRLAMENEQRVGVNSGGMDQAASVMSDPSSALYITFYPTLAASAVPLPPNAVFVCANSLVVADKAVTARHGYNLRVVETLVGARILGNSLGIQIGAKERITYREVIGRMVGEEGGKDDVGADKLENALSTLLDRLSVLIPSGQDQQVGTGATLEQMIQMSGLSKEEFQELYLSQVDVDLGSFQLYNRAQHVFTEARRVLEFRHTCLAAAASSEQASSSTLDTLGSLMNASQRSCCADFECSCPELDLLTSLAVQAGAIGSRLTGAGWGGCTVSLVHESKVDEFIQTLRKTYPPYEKLSDEQFAEAVFATKPGRGACVYKLTE